MKHGLCVLGFVFVVLNLSVVGQAFNEVPNIEMRTCGMRTPRGYTTECGAMFVPEDRSNPNSPMIEIAFAVVKSASNNPAPDPLIYLVGGPGGSIVNWFNSVFQTRFAPFAEHRDVILVDQRGTGLSRPSLFCGNLWERFQEMAGSSIEDERYETDIMLDGLNDCYDHIARNGIDTSFYTSAQNAQDIADLRLALGYESYNIWGGSYGTRLALTIMRDRPAGLRSVILDSVYPPQVDLYTGSLLGGERALGVLFDACRADANCNNAYPDLENEFRTLYDELNENPRRMRVVIPNIGRVNVVVNGYRIYDWTFGWLYGLDDIVEIPRLIHAMAEGDFNEAVRKGFRDQANLLFISWGMYFSVQCSEEIPFATRDSIIPIIDEYPHLEGMLDHRLDAGDSLFNLCTNWNSPMLNPIENEPVVSDIPSLVMAGEFDPITPPEWAILASETLSNHYYVEMPGVGHGVVRSSACGMSIAVDFLNNPDEAPDMSCVETAPAPPFSTAG